MIAIQGTKFEPVKLNSEILLQLVKMKMPIGKYKVTVLCGPPVSYLEWFHQKGFLVVLFDEF
jgi:uncharacterized protein